MLRLIICAIFASAMWEIMDFQSQSLFLSTAAPIIFVLCVSVSVLEFFYLPGEIKLVSYIVTGCWLSGFVDFASNEKLSALWAPLGVMFIVSVSLIQTIVVFAKRGFTGWPEPRGGGDGDEGMVD